MAELVTDPDALSLRVGVRTRSLADERLRFAKQLGVEDVFVDHVTRDEGPEHLTIRPGEAPSVEDLVLARTRAEDAGVRLAGIQSLGGPIYDAIMFGEDGADEQLAAIRELIENMGTARIPILGYQWNPRARNVVFSTSRTKRIRGGAKTRAFDLGALDRPESGRPGDPEYDEAAFWERYESFLEAVLPVAEEAGVRLALHPADPPVVERLEGIPRLFRDVSALARAMEAVPSDHHGLKLCLGCISEMGEDVADVVRRFGRADDLVFIHFRDVAGAMPAFHETFLDEGNFDAAEVVRALDEVGFAGVVIPDHVPAVEGDTDWGHRARGYTAGYLQGLVEAIGDG